jgi:hypothetical protein
VSGRKSNRHVRDQRSKNIESGTNGEANESGEEERARKRRRRFDREERQSCLPSSTQTHQDERRALVPRESNSRQREREHEKGEVVRQSCPEQKRERECVVGSREKTEEESEPLIIFTGIGRWKGCE